LLISTLKEGTTNYSLIPKEYVQGYYEDVGYKVDHDPTCDRVGSNVQETKMVR